MPEAIQYPLDMNSREWKALEDSFAEEFNSRGKEIKRGWNYYNGKHKKQLKIQSDGYDDNVIVNHIEQFIDDLVGFLLGDGISFDSGGDDQSSPADDQIDAMWTASRGAILQNNLSLGGCIEGHPAVRLVPVEGDLPKIQRIRGQQFSVFWDPLDMERVLWYRLQYITGETGKRIDYVRGAIQGQEFNHEAPVWTEIVYTMKNASEFIMSPLSGKWQRDITSIWPFPFAPIVDWQNLPDPNGYYGKADVGGPIDLNDALNFNLSNSQRIVKLWGDPKTVGTGFTAEEVVLTQVGGLFTIPNENAKVYNLEMQSDGAFIQWLAGVLVAGIWGSGGMIDPQTVKDRVGDLTNFGLRVLYNRAIKKTEKKRLLYAEAFEQIAIRGLTIAGEAPPDKVETIWPDVLPEDDVAETQTLSTELDKGIISKETYRDRRGYDNEKETERLGMEGTQNGNVGASILGLLSQNRPFNRGQ